MYDYEDDFGNQDFDNPADDSLEVDYLYGDCSCGWKDSDMFWDKNVDDKNRQIQKMKARHAESHPDCKREPYIRSY